ncbi:response regulator [Megalodesulfovibrio paquesii]
MGALDTVIIFDLQQVLSEVLSLFRGHAEARDVHLLMDIAPELPPTLCGNPLALKQVLLHGINHALQHTRGGELRLEATLARADAEEIVLQLQAVVSGGETADQGWARMAAIARGEDSPAGSPGNFSGLDVCRRLAAGLGSPLEVEQLAPASWCLRFAARMAPDPAGADLAMPPAGANATSSSRLAGLRALVADANRVSREQLCGHLVSLGLTCMDVADGNEATALLRGNLDFALAFLDVQLPGQDGIDVYKGMRKVRQPEVPTVLTAAYFTGRERRKAEQAGIRALLEKPVSLEQLAETITELLALDSPAAASSPAAGLSEQQELLRGARLLVVDDNILNRDLAREMLEGFELQVDTAANGHDAVAAVRTQPYDLIFMDVQMPRMDGYAATRVIRSLPGRQDATIIAITANASTEHVRACLDAGMDDYLGKPFHRQGLLDSIVKWLRRRGERVQAEGLPTRAAGAAPLQAEIPPRPPLPDTLPGIDLSDGLARFDGDAAMLRRFLLEFYEEFDDYDSEILLAAAMQEYDRAAMLAHTLAGAAANVSARGLQARARDLQSALRGQTLRIKPQWDALRDELAHVCQGLAGCGSS